MSVTGLCQICETAEAERTCGVCGAAVCEDDYDADAGACVECARIAGGGVDGGPA
ncbi:hypothetical protein [Candidatus Halobonum tyrrellensis]|uniref:Uncharacterized protein n=1 Tax=Candidatus Halobonum tyrrellensis G22 TaxID=1324957 RepID=V4HG05_9EURY|nr:hypothetical protein [Candidatus Halobonum tyrrellensis]ESP89048.1 hypothetical protein K933_06348 [Candidatus Halobonum tyrrellensis G22]